MSLKMIPKDEYFNISKWKIKIVVQLAVFLVLLIAFGFSVWDQVDKFLLRTTSFARYTRPEENMILPAITFCANPAYKSLKYSSLFTNPAASRMVPSNLSTGIGKIR